MAHTRQIHAGILVLCLAAGAGPGCKTRAPETPPIETAGCKIKVLSTKYDKKNQRFDVSIKLWNEHDERITFELADVNLMFNGGRVAAKRARTKDKKPEVAKQANAEFRWFFEVDQVPAKGTYSVEIREIVKGDMSLGEAAAFSIDYVN